MPMSDANGPERQAAYAAGAAAQKAGEPRTAVPHERGTDDEPNLLHDDWQDGYSASEVGTDEEVPVVEVVPDDDGHVPNEPLPIP
jgi:hypothetical protein